MNNQASTVEQILDLARWAPSGDNTQVWRFEPLGDHAVAVHGFDTRDHCIYDFDGRPSQIALGALLENIRISASSHRLLATMKRRLGSSDRAPIFDVSFTPAASLTPDPLAEFIPIRSVQRRPLQTRPLNTAEKQALESSVGPGHFVHWIEGGTARRRMAQLLFVAAELRLTIPEAYEVHRSVIQWNSRYSEDRVPDQAIGLDPLTTRLMAWVMQNWRRVEFFNKYLAGTWAPRIQLDLLPALFCAAHYVLVAREPPRSLEDYVNAGTAMQRFWLTATQLKLQMQPEMTPLIFSAYARSEKQFSKVPDALERAKRIAAQLAAIIGEANARNAVFMGRIGAGSPARSRSLRLPLESLLVKPGATNGGSPIG